MQLLQNPSRILSAVFGLALLSLCSLAQGQGVSLVVGSGGSLEVEQGVGGTIPVFLDSFGHPADSSLIVISATLAVDADLLGQGEISFDDTGSIFNTANPSPPPFIQDLSIDLGGNGLVNGSDGFEELGTLVFDTSSLNVGDTFVLSFAGSEVRNFTSDILSRTSNVQVAVVASVLLGDTNLDGAVNFLDISPFIAILSVGEFLDQADINRDGEVNFLDISPFINILSSQ